MSSSHHIPLPFSYNIGTGGGGGPSPNTISTPTSASTLYTSPEPLATGQQSHIVVPKTEPDDETSSSIDSGSSARGGSARPPKKKQKRNKPTLSCQECVERKTKTTRSASNGRRMTKPPKKRLSVQGLKPMVPNIADRGFLASRTASSGSVALSTGLLSNVPYSLPTASNVFGIGTQHPFANYWTCEGGLPEV
ncbi:hypothetical protein MGN70_005360 [Eutypa lata]|nr:hypothetical protein MGN70_005360 [Eutypa lata]